MDMNNGILLLFLLTCPGCISVGVHPPTPPPPASDCFPINLMVVWFFGGDVLRLILWDSPYLICPSFSVCCNVLDLKIRKPPNNLNARLFSYSPKLDLFVCFISAGCHSELGELVEPEEEPKGEKPTATPPSTPVRAEEGRPASLT